MLKSRIITALVLLVLLLATLFVLPPIAWAVLMVVMVLQGTSEWSRLSHLSSSLSKFYWGITLLLMIGLLLVDAYCSPTQRAFTHLLVYAISAVFWLMIVPTGLLIGWKVKNPALMMWAGWAVLVPTGLAMIDLRAAPPGPWVLLAIMALVWIADIAAYFSGRKFGKHKLAPSISPGKTWEGVAGAMVAVTIYALTVWFMAPELIPRGALPGLLLAAWWWVGLAVMGDLFESAVKRHAGVKDSGALLPGHGGLLDRIDALTATLPLAAMAVLFQQLGA